MDARSFQTFIRRILAERIRGFVQVNLVRVPVGQSRFQTAKLTKEIDLSK